VIIEPKTFEGFNKILTGVVVPRPIAFVSTISDTGRVNIAPYSFFAASSYDPPLLIFSSSKYNAEGKLKDSLANIEQNEEFVVNIVVEDIVESMNMTATEYPRDVSEFDTAGLTAIESNLIKPPRLKESPVNIECKLERIITLGDDSDPHALVIGEVLLLHVDDTVISSEGINHKNLKPVGLLGGNSYCTTLDTFKLTKFY
jgi:flavin reductase (DIM6/NTAB) family NADH-FMN oxidoreductase RutF